MDRFLVLMERSYQGLIEITKQYAHSLNGKKLLPDFIFEGKEYFETKDEPRLKGLVFYIDPQQKTMVFDKDPRI